MDILIKVLSFVLVFGAVVFFHELGHFVLAKLNDIEVTAFMMGFGPKLLKYQRGETEYSIRLIPLGGAVVMRGEDEDDDSPRSFGAKSVKSRLAVLFAGPIMNFVLAIVIFIVFFFALGAPSDSNKISILEKDMPAAQAGVKVGDVIESVNGQKTPNWNSIVKAIANAGSSEQSDDNSKVVLEIKRGNETLELSMQAEYDKELNRYLVGISSRDKGVLSVFSESFKMTGQIVYETLAFFPRLFKEPELVNQISGPIGIAGIIGDVSEKGILNLLFLTAVISINLGVFNLLPIIPLDGGKILLFIIEGLIKKPVNKKIETAVSVVGLGLILMLFVFVMYNDIVKIFA